MHALHYANEILVHVRLSFQKLLLNIQKQCQKNVWVKSNDAYSLSIRVQATNHISIFKFLCFFLRQHQRQRKCFLSERELKKALRDTLTRAALLGPSYFSVSLQNRRDFLRISGEQRRKRGERVASASCVREEER